MRKTQQNLQRQHQETPYSFTIPKLATQQMMKYRTALEDCKNVILILKNSNQDLEEQIKQKDIIIGRLVQQKLSHQLHMSTCNTEQLKKQIEEGLRREEQMGKNMKSLAEKYEKIIEKEKKEIEKLKSFNRALRVQNNNFREMCNKDSKHRKVGVISSSAQKDTTKAYSLTKINQNNIQEVLSKKSKIMMPYLTPEKGGLSTFNSTALPSTDNNKFISFYSQQKERPRQKQLFSNEYIRTFESAQMNTISTGSKPRGRVMTVESVLSRVRQLLSTSDDQQ